MGSMANAATPTAGRPRSYGCQLSPLLRLLKTPPQVLTKSTCGLRGSIASADMFRFVRPVFAAAHRVPPSVLLRMPPVRLAA